jgi:hypothetical protein
MPSYLKMKKYTEKEIMTAIKRLNRVMNGFYTMETEDLDLTFLDNPDIVGTLLMSKYSILTTISSIEFIMELLKFYGNDIELINQYDDLASDLYDIKNNPTDYSKCSMAELERFCKENYLKMMSREHSFSSFRNFLVLCILVLEIPIKLHDLIVVKYTFHHSIEECFREPIYLIKQEEEYYFIFNKRKNNKLDKQLVYHIYSNEVKNLLNKYFSNYIKNNKIFLTTASGLEMSKANLSNGLINYTIKNLNFPISIHDIRTLYLKEKQNISELNKEIFTF